MSRDSEQVVWILGNDTFLARRDSKFVSAIMSFPKTLALALRARLVIRCG
jgi:hypothetical protein